MRRPAPLSALGLTFTGLLIAATALACKQQPDTDSKKQETEPDEQEQAFLAGAQAEHVTVAIGSTPEQLDPSRTDDRAERRLARNLFEGLVAPAQTTEEAETPEDRVRPGVARSWTVDEEGTTYTFDLRKDAQWSNGDSVTAGDFVYAWKRALDPDRDVPHDRLLDCIRGAAAYRRGDTENWNDVGIETPDPHTLVVHLTSPTPDLLERMAHPVAAPHPRNVVQQHGEQWTQPEHLATNGAYQIADYNPEQGEVALESNPAYWDAASVAIDRVVFRTISDNMEAIEAYRQGKLHWIASPLSVEAASKILDHNDYTREELLATTFFQFHAGAPDAATADSKVRRALSLALNREKIAENVFDGLVESARGFIPASIPNYKSVLSLEYNVERAHRLLDEAGYGDETLNVVLLYRHTPDASRLAEAVREIWQNNLGVEVTLEEAAPKQFQQGLADGNYEVALRNMLAPTADPATMLAPWRFESARWSHAEYNELIGEIETTETPQKRQNLVQQAEELLLHQSIVTPVYHPVGHMLVAESLQGFLPHDRNVHLLKDLSLDEIAQLNAGSAAKDNGG